MRTKGYFSLIWKTRSLCFQKTFCKRYVFMFAASVDPLNKAPRSEDTIVNRPCTVLEYMAISTVIAYVATSCITSTWVIF